MPESIKLEIGFDSGQSLTINVPENAADDIQRGVGGEGSVTVEADDGRYTFALKRITYLRRLTRESRVGFGTG
jgi:hypothetical protein